MWMFHLTALLTLTYLADYSQAAEVCYPPCGCFTNDAPFNDRPLPESYDTQDITWLLFTRQNPAVAREIRWDNIPSLYDPSKRTVYLIHGWTGTISRQLDIKDAFLNALDYNVIVVDWERGAGKPLNYPLAASNTRVVGACSAYLASALGNSFADHYCAGHSLGAQTCGYMGKATGGALGRVTGLDPAGPLFNTDDTRVRLDKTDCLFMDNIHTNANVLGIGLNVGHVDFYPNKGGAQPPCHGSDPPLTGNCDHGICRNYLINSLIDEDCFRSNPCTSVEDADAGLCNSCSPGETCQRMGFPSEHDYLTSGGSAQGPYYLTTVDSGLYCDN